MRTLRSSCTIGHVCDVPLRMTAGAALVAGAVLCLVAGIGVRAGHGVAGYGLAAAAAAAFPASLLVHELGHALVARRCGVAVREVRLCALGARSRLEEPAGTPGRQMAIAAAGPAASMALGAATVALGRGLQWFDADGLVAVSLTWFGVGNLVLGGFNLVPGLPLDGGGIVVGWLWGRWGDQARAGRATIGLGRAVGAALVAVGVGYGISQRSAMGVWPTTVGCQLLLGARSAEAAFDPARGTAASVDLVATQPPGVEVIDLTALEVIELSEQVV